MATTLRPLCSFFYQINLVLTVTLFHAAATATEQSPVDTPMFPAFSRIYRSITSLLGQQYACILRTDFRARGALQLIAFCVLIGAVGSWRSRRRSQQRLLGSDQSDTEKTDPGLLRKHSTFRSYTTSFGTYRSIRTFYRPHTQAEKLPSVPNPIPLLVFIHGLGGSLAQFNPLLTSLVNIAPCLGIDLPGCGLSEFSPTAWKCYTPPALAELVAKAIEEHCSANQKQGVVLIAHSMGCSLSAILASPMSQLRGTPHIDVLGLVGLCPRVSPLSEQERVIFKRILSLPTAVFDIWRRWDRRGGPDSKSVARFVGKDADPGAKKLQERFNAQSQTSVWRRMAWGMLPKPGQHIKSVVVESGLPGIDLWATLHVPILLIGGESDQITRPEEILQIGCALRDSGKAERAQANYNRTDKPIDSTSNGSFTFTSNDLQQDVDMQDIGAGGRKRSEMIDIRDTLGVTSISKNGRIFRTKILPAPASHALIYDPVTYRTVAGNIQPFLAEHIDSRLSIGWQLTYLSTEGKWDVKNLKKWSDIQPVSEPIAGIFRALKTLRQIDDTHSPKQFLREWIGKIWAVVDISHDSPVYDPKDFEDGGIEYHKLPTVSKIPPTPEETEEFIDLIDRLRARHTSDDGLIGVHCHYGFNRTGFFICAYLIERECYHTIQALEEFKKHRPEGIKHEHFINTLYARYPQS